MSLFEKKEKKPLEMYSLAVAGAEAKTVKRVLGPVLEDEKDTLLRNLANAKPDALEYARLAGQASMLFRLQGVLDYSEVEGEEAGKGLKHGVGR